MNQAELDRRILSGLVCEWEQALWVLPSSERAKMRPPLFRLDESAGRHGLWSAEKREITISRHLVMNHPWDAIREVLLHEMAHQLKDEVLHDLDESPHGPAFKRACNLLRANPKASGNYPTLDERVLKGCPDERDQILSKISKLMALAESHNRFEAEAAMAKAHALILKYNTDDITRRSHLQQDAAYRDELQSYASIFLGKPALRQSLENYHLAHILQDFYFVKGIWVSAFVLEKQKMGRVLEVSGSLKNIQIAAYIYDCVNRYVEHQWLEYSDRKRLTRRTKTEFAIGILTGFRSKLAQSVESTKHQSGCTSLIMLDDPWLDRYIQFRYPRLVGIRRGASIVDREARRDGERLGKKLIISKGIDRKHQGGIGLLSFTR